MEKQFNVSKENQKEIQQVQIEKVKKEQKAEKLDLLAKKVNENIDKRSSKQITEEK